MTDSTDGKNRDGVLKKLEQADTEDAGIEKKARELLGTVTHQRDLNKAFSETIETIPSDNYVSNENWRDLHSALDNRLAHTRLMLRMRSGSDHGNSLKTGNRTAKNGQICSLDGHFCARK